MYSFLMRITMKVIVIACIKIHLLIKQIFYRIMSTNIQISRLSPINIGLSKAGTVYKTGKTACLTIKHCV